MRDGRLNDVVIRLEGAVEHADRANIQGDDYEVRGRFMASRGTAVEAMMAATKLLTGTHTGPWSSWRGVAAGPNASRALALADQARTVLRHTGGSGTVVTDLSPDELDRTLVEAAGLIDTAIDHLASLLEEQIRADGWHAIVRERDTGTLVAFEAELADREAASKFAFARQWAHPRLVAWVIERRGESIDHHEQIMPSLGEGWLRRSGD